MQVVVVGSFQAHDWDEIYKRIEDDCGQYGCLDVIRKLNWRQSLRQRRWVYDVSYLAEVTIEDSADLALNALSD